MDSEVREHKFVIKGTMPTLNEYLSACASSPYKGHKLKQDNMLLAINAIRLYLRGYHADKLIVLHYVFYEPNKKRDKDNIFAFASKVVQDSLQKTKTISNDGWKNIENFTHEFYVDKEHPRIEVTIEEIED